MAKQIILDPLPPIEAPCGCRWESRQVTCVGGPLGSYVDDTLVQTASCGAGEHRFPGQALADSGERRND